MPLVMEAVLAKGDLALADRAYDDMAKTGALGASIASLGKADLANRNFGDTHRHIIQKSVGFYAQDDWKVRPRLTLTFGLRWEVNGALGEKENLGANFFPDKGLVTLGTGGLKSLYNKDLGDFGPRLGFAWDVFGNGKLALRGGYATTYDVANFGALAAPYSFSRSRSGAFTQPFQGSASSNGVSLSGAASVETVFSSGAVPIVGVRDFSPPSRFTTTSTRVPGWLRATRSRRFASSVTW